MVVVVVVLVEMITFPSSEEREMGSNGGWKIHTLSHGETYSDFGHGLMIKAACGLFWLSLLGLQETYMGWTVD